jgi:hypothetical protein
MPHHTPAPASALRTQPIMIAGLGPFQAPAPYTQGHVCTEAEARALNSALADNLRANFGKHAKAAIEAHQGDQDDLTTRLRAEFASYAASYSLNGSARDPVARLAARLARDIVDEGLRKRKLDPRTIPPEQIASLVEKVASSESVLGEARRRVAARQDIATDVFDDLGLGEGAEATPQANAP